MTLVQIKLLIKHQNVLRDILPRLSLCKQQHILYRPTCRAVTWDKLTYLFMDEARGRLFVGLAQLLVLTLSRKGHHVLLKDVTSLWGVSKILHVVKNA